MGVMHSDERRRMEKSILREFEDQLVEVFRRYTKRIHEGSLDGAGDLGDPGLVVTTFDHVDFGKRHGIGSFLSVSMQRFDGQRDALTAADAKRDKATPQAVTAHRMNQLGREHCTGGAYRMTMGHGAAFDVDDVLG